MVGDGSCTRFSSSLPWEHRVASAAELLEKFAPDLISLQFVCYGFHPRGMDWRLAGRLKTICGQVPVQITFHELWIGSESGAALKDRFIGALQRRGVMSLLEKLRPLLVHTTNPAYVALLKQRGVISRRLPLFGSVPVMEGLPQRVNPINEWKFGIFGSLHPVWPPEPLLERLLATGKKIVITHIGNIGRGNALWERMKRDKGGRIDFERVGELPAAGVAKLFAQMDFGIATTPWEIIGKSASVAAMLEHGLPVIVNRDEVHYEGWVEEGYSPRLIKMGTALGDSLETAPRHAPHSIRAEVVTLFLADLKGVL
jgi:hypothetical protein